MYSQTGGVQGENKTAVSFFHKQREIIHVSVCYIYIYICIQIVLVCLKNSTESNMWALFFIVLVCNLIGSSYQGLYLTLY